MFNELKEKDLDYHVKMEKIKFEKHKNSHKYNKRLKVQLISTNFLGITLSYTRILF